MMRDCIQMYIKYCGPCKKQNSHKLTKSRYLLHSIPMESKTWNQIGTKKLIIRKLSYISREQIFVMGTYLEMYVFPVTPSMLPLNAHSSHGII